MKTITFIKGSAAHRIHTLVAEIPSTYTELLAESELDRDLLNKALADLRQRGACMRRPMGNMGMRVWVAVPDVRVVVVDPNAWREPVQLCMFTKRGRKPRAQHQAKPTQVRRITLKLDQISLDL